jgi:hypothetical protein
MKWLHEVDMGETLAPLARLAGTVLEGHGGLQEIRQREAEHKEEAADTVSAEYFGKRDPAALALIAGIHTIYQT